MKQTIKLRPMSERPEDGRAFYLYDPTDKLVYIPSHIGIDECETYGVLGWLYADEISFIVEDGK